MRIVGLVALLLAGCEPGSQAVPAPAGVDAGCLPLPATCGERVECVVEARADGTRVCSGESCCEQFCAINGCGVCCAGTR